MSSSDDPRAPLVAREIRTQFGQFVDGDGAAAPIVYLTITADDAVATYALAPAQARQLAEHLLARIGPPA